MTGEKSEIITLGWREWVNFPDLGLERIKAKVDTGARTSSLHAFSVHDFEENGVHRVEFKMHPRQKDNDTVVVCKADVIDQRVVRDSGGHSENRWVIETPVSIGKHAWTIELNLTSRDDMLFRLLIGREAIRGRALVDPGRSYLTRRRKRQQRD